MPANSSNCQPEFVSTPPDPRWLSRRVAMGLTPILLIFGLECWLVLGGGNYGRLHRLLFVIAAIVAGLIPPIRRAIQFLWNAANTTPRKRIWIALLIAIISSLFIVWTERYHHIPLKPQFQDEFSYLIQMRMLARGHFWMPAIPLPQYFDSFYLFVKPVYASMYFPGAAMMYVPALWLHLPYLAGPLAVAGLAAAFLYLVISEILDGASGILAVLFLLSLKLFRVMSVTVMSQIPMLLLGLVMTWATLRWRQKYKKRWLVLLGAAAGWGAITRPADALCFAIVLGLVIAVEMRKQSWSQRAKTAALVILPTLPFLLLQLTLNRNITGHWLTTPFGQYNDAHYPGAFGFHTGPVPAPSSAIPQEQQFYETNIRYVIEQHQLKNLIPFGLKSERQFAQRAGIVDPLLWLILPLSLLAMWNRKFWLVWGMLPVYLLVLSFYAFTWDLPHYFVMVIPALILLQLLPIRFLTSTFPNRADMIHTMVGLSMIVLALAAMPQLDRLVYDQYFARPELDQIDRDLATNVSAPAVVMFHYNKNTIVDGKKITNDPSEEPVFNSDVAWPDNAPIIRARDLNTKVSAVGKPGDRDQALYEYYLRLDPARVFYLYNRGAGEGRLRRLGTAPQILQNIAAASTAK
jgi:hypothetical protein